MIYSLEKPRLGLVSHQEEGQNPADFQVVPGFRVRTIPVLGEQACRRLRGARGSTAMCTGSGDDRTLQA